MNFIKAHEKVWELANSVIDYYSWAVAHVGLFLIKIFKLLYFDQETSICPGMYCIVAFVFLPLKYVDDMH